MRIDFIFQLTVFISIHSNMWILLRDCRQRVCQINCREGKEEKNQKCFEHFLTIGAQQLLEGV